MDEDTKEFLQGCGCMLVGFVLFVLIVAMFTFL